MTTHPAKLVLTDDIECQITEMYDDEGEETTNREDAYSIVGEFPNGHWISMLVEPDDITALSVH